MGTTTINFSFIGTYPLDSERRDYTMFGGNGQRAAADGQRIGSGKKLGEGEIGQSVPLLFTSIFCFVVFALCAEAMLRRGRMGMKPGLWIIVHLR